MRRVIPLILVSLCLLAQNPNTAKYPAQLATDQDLLVARDNSTSTLTAGINSTTLSIPVADGSKFTAYELVTIDSELILICSVSGNTLTVCSGGRGFGGTTAAAHDSGAAVDGFINAWHHNQLAAELKAVQSSLGANLGNVALAGHNHDGTYQALSQRNQPNGYAGLDASGLLAVSQIPGLPANKITSGQLPTAYGGTGRGVTWQPGSVTFINSSNLFEQDNANLFWDNTNKRLGIGNNTPTEKLEVTGNVKATTFIGSLNGAAPWSQLSGKPSLSGTGSCTNQFVRGLNAEAAPTCATVGTADVAAALKTGVINYTFFDVNNDLPDTLDIPSIFVNRGPDITITEVYCEINGGSASINLQRNDGSPANILSSNLTCSTSGATTTSFVSGENSILSGHKINHVTVSVGSGLRRMNIAIKYTVN